MKNVFIMIKFHLLYDWELWDECRKQGIDDDGNRDELIAALKSHFKNSPPTQAQMASRIEMNIAEGTDYNDFYFYQLENECLERDIPLLVQDINWKLGLVELLLKNDEQSIRVKIEELNGNNDKDGAKKRELDNQLSAFFYFQSEVKFRGLKEQWDLHDQVIVSNVSPDSFILF